MRGELNSASREEKELEGNGERKEKKKKKIEEKKIDWEMDEMVDEGRCVTIQSVALFFSSPSHQM
jgi:hypothetical protein